MGMNAGSSYSESRNALKGDNMSIKNVYSEIISFENLLKAEKDARAISDEVVGQYENLKRELEP